MKKRLRLKKVTLRDLDNDALRNVAGGATLSCQGCPQTASCQNTNCESCWPSACQSGCKSQCGTCGYPCSQGCGTGATCGGAVTCQTCQQLTCNPSDLSCWTCGGTCNGDTCSPSICPTCGQLTCDNCA